MKLDKLHKNWQTSSNRKLLALRGSRFAAKQQWIRVERSNWFIVTPVIQVRSCEKLWLWCLKKEWQMDQMQSLHHESLLHTGWCLKDMEVVGAYHYLPLCYLLFHHSNAKEQLWSVGVREEDPNSHTDCCHSDSSLNSNWSIKKAHGRSLAGNTGE